MGFVRVNAFSFVHCVASPFHSFGTTRVTQASTDVPFSARAGMQQALLDVTMDAAQLRNLHRTVQNRYMHANKRTASVA